MDGEPVARPQRPHQHIVGHVPGAGRHVQRGGAPGGRRRGAPRRFRRRRRQSVGGGGASGGGGAVGGAAAATADAAVAATAATAAVGRPRRRRPPCGTPRGNGGALAWRQRRLGVGKLSGERRQGLTQQVCTDRNEGVPPVGGGRHRRRATRGGHAGTRGEGRPRRCGSQPSPPGSRGRHRRCTPGRRTQSSGSRHVDQGGRGERRAAAVTAAAVAATGRRCCCRPRWGGVQEGRVVKAAGSGTVEEGRMARTRRSGGGVAGRNTRRGRGKSKTWRKRWRKKAGAGQWEERNGWTLRKQSVEGAAAVTRRRRAPAGTPQRPWQAVVRGVVGACGGTATPRQGRVPSRGARPAFAGARASAARAPSRRWQRRPAPRPTAGSQS